MESVFFRKKWIRAWGWIKKYQDFRKRTFLVSTCGFLGEGGWGHLSNPCKHRRGHEIDNDYGAPTIIIFTPLIYISSLIILENITTFTSITEELQPSLDELSTLQHLLTNGVEASRHMTSTSQQTSHLLDVIYSTMLDADSLAKGGSLTVSDIRLSSLTRDNCLTYLFPDLRKGFIPGAFIPGGFHPRGIEPTGQPRGFVLGQFIPGRFIPGAFIPGVFLLGWIAWDDTA